MFVSDRLVFTELHKTGGTHICRLLNDFISGQQIGKHNRVPIDLWDRFIVGSVRNPWDWYVSLWAFGCAGNGSVRRCVTRRFDMRYAFRQLPKEMGASRPNLLKVYGHTRNDVQKPTRTWIHLYSDHSNAQLFRDWLRLLFSLERRLDIGEGFGFSPVSERSGLLTYRYLKLFSKLEARLYHDERLSTLDGILHVWKENQLVDFIVRNEHLEEDLLCAVRDAGYEVSAEEERALMNAKTNRTNSSERHPSEYYYDQSTMDLVAEREAFVIQRHNYLPPNN